jgi:Flp pilus assembly protein TadG
MPKFLKNKRRFLLYHLIRGDSGTAAVEFAMCLPLLMTLLFFGIEIGRLLVDFSAVSKSLRDATRYLSQVEMTCPGAAASSGPLSSYINNAPDETTARNLALTGTPDTPSTSSDYLLHYWSNPSSLTMTVSCSANTSYQGIYKDVGLIPQITVSAAVPFNFIWGTTFANAASITINLSHTQTHIGG